MMINCPKCGFLQEKDVYCAQCGVNMDTYKPPKKPLLKKIIGNWMVQLGVLFLVILAIVTWDNLSSKGESRSRSELPPVANRIARGEYQEAETASAQAEEVTMEKSSFAPTQKAETRERFQDKDTSAKKSKPFNKRASMKIIALARPSMDAFFKVGRRVDEGVYIYTRKQLKDFLKNNRGSMKSFGTSRSPFTPGQPMEIFLGEEDVETGNNLGFFTSLNVTEGSTGDAIQFEVRFWHQLQPNGEASSPLVYESTMAHQETIVIVDPSVHDIEFTQEERNLLDGSDSLKGLNSESFIDSDAALFLEIK